MPAKVSGRHFSCATLLSGSANPAARALHPTTFWEVFMERRYGALRFVSGLMKVIGAISIIVGILGIASTIYYMSQSHNYSGLGVSVLWTVGSILTGILWWAAAELIHVLIDIEYNTRRWGVVEKRVVPEIAAD